MSSALTEMTFSLCGRGYSPAHRGKPSTIFVIAAPPSWVATCSITIAGIAPSLTIRVLWGVFASGDDGFRQGSPVALRRANAPPKTLATSAAHETVALPRGRATVSTADSSRRQSLFPASRQPERHSIPIAPGPAQFNDSIGSARPRSFPLCGFSLGAGTADRMLFIIGNYSLAAAPTSTAERSCAVSTSPCCHRRRGLNIGWRTRSAYRTCRRIRQWLPRTLAG
jgi:hypothetical protein